MLATRIALILAVSIVTITVSFILDFLLAPLPAIPQFLIQVTLLVLLHNEFHRLALEYAPRLGLTERDVTGAFFFAAPLAAVGSMSLFADIRRTLFGRVRI